MKSGLAKENRYSRGCFFWSCGRTAPLSVTCKRQSRQVRPHRNCRVNPAAPKSPRGGTRSERPEGKKAWGFHPFSCGSSGSVVHLRHRLDFLRLIDELLREIAGGDGVSRGADRGRNAGGRRRRGQQGRSRRHEDGADRDRGDGEKCGLAGEIFAVDHGGLLVISGLAEIACPMETTLGSRSPVLAVA